MRGAGRTCRLAISEGRAILVSYHMPVIPFYIHLLHTQPDLLEKSQGTAEIKFREC